MELITKSKTINSKVIEMRTQNGAFRVVVFDQFGRISNQRYYSDEKRAKGAFYRYCSQVKNNY